MKLQRDWIMQGDSELGELCAKLDLVEPVALVSELERKSGVVRTFESMIYTVFHKINASAESSYFENTGKFYMDGIRAAAPGVASRVVDTSRQRTSAALERLDSNVTRSQWSFAEVDRWTTAQERLQSMLASVLWLLKSVHLEPHPEDLASVSSSQQEVLQTLA